MQELFYVEHTGHRWAKQATSFATEVLAMEHAKHSCGEASQTTVYDCSAGPIGRVVAIFNRDGSRIV